MKFIRLVCLLSCAALLAACTYHSKLPRDIFAAPVAETRVPASVLVCADKTAQKQVVFKDYHSQNSVHAYKIDVTDGSLVAAAEALATVFETVEVAPSSRAKQYTYRAELNYTVTDSKTDPAESIQWFGGQPPVLETRVQLTLFNAQTGAQILSLFSARQSRIEMSTASAVAQRVENKGKTLFLPVTGPVYTQQFGDDLRDTLSRDLAYCLAEIARTLEQQRNLFEPAT